MWSSFIALVLAVMVHRAPADNNYRLCVAESSAESCLKLVQLAGLQISCVSAPDRAACLEKIRQGDADFMQVDPEDMYVAARMQGQNFKIFSEVRAADNLDEDHRYEAVALIRNSLTLSNIRDLVGKGSCHTGIGRTVGYKVPVTRLVQLGVLEPLTDPNLTPRENELRSLSRAFSRACIVGKWAPDAETDARLKSSYANLCSLCLNPGTCDSTDKYSGYGGAIKCVNENGGDVAWTKYSEVKNFFGLNPDKTAQADPADFSFLCRDGSRIPVTSPPCSWAARPWQAYLCRGDDTLVSNVDKVRQEMTKAQRWVEQSGDASGAALLQATLGFTAIEQTVVPREPITPQDFLLKSHYSDVIEREVGSLEHKIRVCLDTEDLTRCQQLSEVAYSRDIRPRIECIKSVSCVQQVQQGTADVTPLGPYQAYFASRQNSMHVEVEEVTGDEFILGVTSVTSGVQSLREVSGKSVCIEDTPGAHYSYFSALETAQQSRLKCSTNGFISFPECGYTPQSSNKFSAMEIKSDSCNGISSAGEESTAIKSCLDNDIAFISSRHLASLADVNSKYRLLCKNGSSASYSDFKQCNLIQLPARALAVSNYLGQTRIEEMRMAFLDLSNLLTKRPQVFKLGTSTIFSSGASSLRLFDPDQSLHRKFDSQFDEFTSKCPTQ